MQKNLHKNADFEDNFLSDGSFECDLEKFLCFDGELHGEFVHHLFGVAVDDEPYGIFDTYSPLAAVEKLVVADFGGGGFVLDGGCRIGDNHIGEGMCAAFVA